MAPQVRFRALAAAATLLTLATAAAVPAAGQAAPVALTDIADHWASGEIQAAVESGWVNGYPDGTFQPERDVSRAEFLKMLSLLLDQTQVARPVTDERLGYFVDRMAETDHWSAVQGYGKGALAYQVLEPADYPMAFTTDGEIRSFVLSPDQPLTRLEAAVMLTRALGSRYEAERPWFHPGEVPAPTLAFADGSRLPDWSLGWVATAAGSGVIRGYPDGSFGGERPIKRAEAVAMLRRLADAPRRQPDLLGEVTTYRTDLPNYEGLPLLMEANRNLVAELDLHITGEADEPHWAVEHAWFQVDRTAREAVLQNHAVALYRKLQAMDLEPLQLHGVKVTFRTDLTHPLATVTYDGEQFTFTETRPLDPAVAYPDLAANLLGRITVMADRSTEQIARSKANLAEIEQSLAHVSAGSLHLFPFQYLSDWFRLEPQAVEAWARQRAAAHFEQVRPAIEAVGGRLEKVELQIAPDDTARRIGPYRSLLIGDSLRHNPVLVATYDGLTLTVEQRPDSLFGYYKALAPVYAQEQCGEGCGRPVVDPPVAEAQQVLRTVIMTYGLTGK